MLELTLIADECSTPLDSSFLDDFALLDAFSCLQGSSSYFYSRFACQDGVKRAPHGQGDGKEANKICNLQTCSRLSATRPRPLWVSVPTLPNARINLYVPLSSIVELLLQGSEKSCERNVLTSFLAF